MNPNAQVRAVNAETTPKNASVIPVYVILSHKDSQQVERLIRAIRRSSPDSHVFVSHDSRHAAAPTSPDPQVRIKAHGAATDWGSWELVEQTLAAFRWARDEVAPGLLTLVSGQCYPIRPLAAWEHEFLAGDGGWLGTAQPLRYRPQWGRRRGEGQDDLTRYTYRWYRAPATVLPLPALGVRLRSAVVHRLEPVLSIRRVNRGRGLHYGFRRIKTPFGPGRACYKGSQWLTLDSALLAYVTDELQPGKPLYEYYRRTVIPDESLLQTALSWKQPPQRNALVSYCEHDASGDLTTWTLEDLDRLLASGAPFARKVDPVRSEELLEALDEVTRPWPPSRNDERTSDDRGPGG